jgi:hypothetical protein
VSGLGEFVAVERRNKTHRPPARQIDTPRNPLTLTLAPGQAHDIMDAPPLSDMVQPGAFPTDKGYHSDAKSTDVYHHRRHVGHGP